MSDNTLPQSIRATAQALGVSPTTVLKVLHEATTNADGTIKVSNVKGLDGKYRPNRRYDITERDEQIRALRDTGQSVRAIAKEVGCSVGTVHRVISKEST